MYDKQHKLQQRKQVSAYKQCSSLEESANNGNMFSSLQGSKTECENTAKQVQD